MTTDPAPTPVDAAQALLGALCPPLDADALEQLCALDPGGRAGLLARVLRTYDSSTRRLLAQLDAARSGGDRHAQRHVAHTLKSSSRSIGALRLSQLCADTEAAIREQRFDGLDRLLDSVEKECRQLLATLEAALPLV